MSIAKAPPRRMMRRSSRAAPGLPRRIVRTSKRARNSTTKRLSAEASRQQALEGAGTEMPKAGAPESATLNLREVREGEAEVLEGAQAIAAGQRPAECSDSRAQSLAEPP